jgi:hypothetical protein
LRATPRRTRPSRVGPQVSSRVGGRLPTVGHRGSHR